MENCVLFVSSVDEPYILTFNFYLDTYFRFSALYKLEYQDYSEKSLLMILEVYP